jgi:hypothetical protein
VESSGTTSQSFLGELSDRCGQVLPLATSLGEVQAVQRRGKQGEAEEVVLPIVTIEVNHDRVIVEGVCVPRPNWVAASVWIHYWEAVKKGSFDEGYTRGYNDGERDAQDRNRGY